MLLLKENALAHFFRVLVQMHLVAVLLLLNRCHYEGRLRLVAVMLLLRRCLHQELVSKSGLHRLVRRPCLLLLLACL